MAQEILDLNEAAANVKAACVELDIRWVLHQQALEAYHQQAELLKEHRAVFQKLADAAMGLK